MKFSFRERRPKSDQKATPLPSRLLQCHARGATPRLAHQRRNRPSRAARARRRLGPGPAGLVFEDKYLLFRAVLCGVPQFQHATSLSPRTSAGADPARRRRYLCRFNRSRTIAFFNRSAGRPKPQQTECRRHGLRRRRHSFDLQSLSSWLSVGG